MTSWMLPLLLATGLSAQTPEGKPIPSDSTQVVANGCLKGRLFRATARPGPDEADVVSSADISGRSFRLNGPKAVMDDVKKHDKHLVRVVGVVRKVDLQQPGLGTQIGNTRVVIGAPRTSDPTGRPPVPGIAVMDVTSVQFLAEECKPG